MELEVNNDIFFIIKDGVIIVWDYKNHTQFELSMEYFKKIIEVSSKSISLQDNKDEILLDLLENNIITHNKQYIDNWNYDILSKIFHLGTSDIIQNHSVSSPLEFEIDYLKYCHVLNNKKPPEIQKNHLDKYQLPLCDVELFKFPELKDCLKKRKTVRVFKDEVISINILSTLLYYSFGYIHQPSEIGEIGKRKASPSGGNLHPTEAYIITKDIGSLENGLYFYDADSHSLNTLRRNATTDWLPKGLLGQYFSQNANIHVFLTFRFSLGAWKYPHSRGYRAALLDVGHISQTFQLVATALGLNTWITGAFEDSTINTYLGIDGENEAVIFYLSAANSNGEVNRPEFYQLEENHPERLI